MNIATFRMETIKRMCPAPTIISTQIKPFRHSTMIEVTLSVALLTAAVTEIRQPLKKHEMTMAEFVTVALQDELHPKFNIQEEKNMGNMRTLAFQVPEELFQKIKDYLQRNKYVT